MYMSRIKHLPLPTPSFPGRNFLIYIHTKILVESKIFVKEVTKVPSKRKKNKTSTFLI